MKMGFRNLFSLPMIKAGTEALIDWTRVVLDLIYPQPPNCPACGRIDRCPGETAICSRCLQRLPIIEKPICDRCGRPLRLRAHEPCPECLDNEFYYQKSRAVGLYRDYLRTLILAVKYRGRPDLAEPLGELLAARLEGERELRRVDAVIPVPLHAERLLRRGYNQAELLARPLAKRFRLALIPDAMERTRATELQSRLSREERLSNVSGAFRVARPGAVRGKKILLVDDILTTGFTASECAKMLLAAGAIWVGVLTLATGLIEEQWLNPEEC